MKADALAVVVIGWVEYLAVGSWGVMRVAICTLNAVGKRDVSFF